MRRINLLSVIDRAGGRPDRSKLLPLVRKVFKLRVVATVEGVQNASRLICSFVVRNAKPRGNGI